MKTSEADPMMSLVTDAQDQSERGDNHATERRRGLRISQQRPIKVYEPDSARFIGGQTSDISATGLRIELPMSAPVQQGRLLSIHVGIGSQGETLANRRQMIPARVVWIHRDSTEGRSRLMAGVEFLASIAAHLDAA
jgi:PilZ domain